jgi:hypothetical protein
MILCHRLARTALGLLAATVLAIAAGGFAAPAHAAALANAPAPARAAALASAAVQVCHINGALPDATCQPGVTNPDVTPSTINQTICVSGWTKTVRPPVSYTGPLKVQQIGEYGYSDTSTADYEEDHLIPLELGGAPRDPHNLWPQPRYAGAGVSASDKDAIENRLKKDVCSGTVGLVAAQQAIATDWTTALQKVGG